MYGTMPFLRGSCYELRCFIEKVAILKMMLLIENRAGLSFIFLCKYDGQDLIAVLMGVNNTVENSIKNLQGGCSSCDTYVRCIVKSIYRK